MKVAARPYSRCDLLHPVLEHQVSVGHLERGAVGDVDLVLADAGLALGEFDRDAGLDHLVADAGDDVLLPRRLEELVVLDRRGVGDEVLPPLLGRLGERVEEQVELELGGALDHEAPLGGPLDLAPEDAAGGHLDRLALHGHEVAQDEHTSRLPGDGPHRLGVDDGVEIAVAGLPVGELVARQRIHVDVAGQEVVAGLDAVVGHVIEEEGAGDPLADGAPLEVRECHDDGVHVARTDLVREGLERQHPCTLTHRARIVHYPNAADVGRGSRTGRPPTSGQADHPAPACRPVAGWAVGDRMGYWQPCPVPAPAR